MNQTSTTDTLRSLLDGMETIVRGKRGVLELALISALASGHLLLEDVPGVGKTTLAQALARAIGASFQRVQFTSDMLPSDILGVSVFNQASHEFEFKPGPIFTNLVLADEINRTTPRTQSALLEAMAERRVSLDGTTHTLPQPFLVIATQNPMEFHGTYPLPESQLDRFLMRLSIGYPPPSVERELLISRRRAEPVRELKAQVTLQEFVQLQALVDEVRVESSVADYAMRLIEATRQSQRLARGVSTRGGLALMRAVRARAVLKGRDFALPDDIAQLAVPVLAHRVSLGGPARALGGARDQSEAVIIELLNQVEVPV